jgi:HEAT repeat protein
MERLADLLAVGHTWSQAETVRQSEELAAIRRLVKEASTHEAALDLLLQALHENDERISWSASEKFATFDHGGDAVGSLVKLLDHENLRVRAGAARALASGYGAKAAPAVAALGRCVAHPFPDLKVYAVLALHDIGPAARDAVPALKEALAEKDQSIRVGAAKALWRIDGQPEGVISVFTAVLKEGNPEERYEAAEQLKDMGPWAAPAVPALIKAFADKEWTNRCAVAEALGAIGSHAAAAVPALTSTLKNDENSLVRANVADALGKIGDPQAVAVLIEALEGEDDSVRFNAVEALEAFGHQAQAAVPALVRVVKNEQGNAWKAADALGAIDAQGVGTPALIEALGSRDPTMRRFAAYGLSRIGRKAAAAEKALHDRLSDSDPGARIAAAAAHWSVSGKSDEAMAVLRPILRATDNWHTRMWAADAVAEIGPAAKVAVPELIECLTSDTQYVVTSSTKALGKIGPDAASAIPALIEQLENSDNEYIRVCIARALWHINRSEKALPVLQDALKHSDDWMSISQAAEAIGEMGALGNSSAPLLGPLLKHSESLVREAAAKALTQLEAK